MVTGDGETDDTAAINAAIAAGGRCYPGNLDVPNCNSTSVLGAVVYFPPGSYLVSQSLFLYYYTIVIGSVSLALLYCEVPCIRILTVMPFSLWTFPRSSELPTSAA